MTRKRKQKCIKGLSASASSRLRKRVRDERLAAAAEFVDAATYYRRSGVPCWWTYYDVTLSRAAYNRARALAAECGV